VKLTALVTELSFVSPHYTRSQPASDRTQHRGNRPLLHPVEQNLMKGDHGNPQTGMQDVRHPKCGSGVGSD